MISAATLLSPRLSFRIQLTSYELGVRALTPININRYSRVISLDEYCIDCMEPLIVMPKRLKYLIRIEQIFMMIIFDGFHHNLLLP
jgi:hypothetical protein